MFALSARQFSARQFSARQFSARQRRATTALALLSAIVPATVALTAVPASAALPTCTTFAETSGGALVPSAARNNIDCLLERGDRGDGVKRLQGTLVECYKANIVDDGVFGARTEAALERVQSSVGVTVDGIYGPATRRAMKHPYLGDSPCGRVS